MILNELMNKSLHKNDKKMAGGGFFSEKKLKMNMYVMKIINYLRNNEIANKVVNKGTMQLLMTSMKIPAVYQNIILKVLFFKKSDLEFSFVISLLMDIVGAISHYNKKPEEQKEDQKQNKEKPKEKLNIEGESYISAKDRTPSNSMESKRKKGLIVSGGKMKQTRKSNPWVSHLKKIVAELKASGSYTSYKNAMTEAKKSYNK
jgi:hypothetical protein